MRAAEVAKTNRLLSIFAILPVDGAIGRLAGELRRTWHRAYNGISLGDYLIAATCQWHGEEFATLNVKHYPMIEGLRPAFSLVQAGADSPHIDKKRKHHTATDKPVPAASSLTGMYDADYLKELREDWPD